MSEARGRLAAVDPARLLLVTDFDGTLAPIVADREAACALPEAEAALQTLAPKLLAVAVVSGRGNQDLAGRLPKGVRPLGDYGVAQLPPAERSALDAADSELTPILAEHRWVDIERKEAAIALHFRADPDVGPQLAEEASTVARKHGLTARVGRKVVELRPPSATKRAAVERLLGELRPDGVVFIGDDENDLPAVELVNALDIPHLTVGVASDEAPAGLLEACDLVVDGPEGVAAFLADLG